MLMVGNSWDFAQSRRFGSRDYEVVERGKREPEPTCKATSPASLPPFSVGPHNGGEEVAGIEVVVPDEFQESPWMSFGAGFGSCRMIA
jgi:hypothetical protein